MNRKNWETYFDAVRRQKWETAMDALQKISAEDKNNPQVYLKLGDAYQKIGHTEQAIASYHLSARLLRAQGFSQKAVALYKIIHRLDPHDSNAQIQFAQVMQEIETEKKSSHTGSVLPCPSGRAADEVKEGMTTAAVGQTLPDVSKEPRKPQLFSGMSEEAFIGMLRDFEVRTYAPGEKVIEEGDSGDSLYLIVSGRAKVTAHLMGKEIELAELGDGDLFGEVAFLTGRPRTAEVVAAGPLNVFEIKRLDIERIIEGNPEVLSHLEDFYEKRAKDTIMKIRARPKNN